MGPIGHYQVETRLWLAMITICRFIVMAVAGNAWMLSVARGWPSLIRGPKPARALINFAPMT